MRCRATRDRAAAERALDGSFRREVSAAAAANLATTESELAAAEAELARVQQRVSEVSGRFSRQSEIIRLCGQWAASRGIVLPDADTLSARASVPETRAIDYSEFSRQMQVETATAPSSSALSASAAPAAGPPPGLLGRLREALAGAAS